MSEHSDARRRRNAENNRLYKGFRIRRDGRTWDVIDPIGRRVCYRFTVEEAEAFIDRIVLPAVAD